LIFIFLPEDSEVLDIKMWLESIYKNNHVT
jgi:hypothetical protein